MQLISRGLFKKNLNFSLGFRYYSKQSSDNDGGINKILSFEEFKLNREKIKEKQDLLKKLHELHHKRDGDDLQVVIDTKQKINFIEKEIDNSMKSFQIQSNEQKIKELEQWKEFLKVKGAKSQEDIKKLNKYEFERWKYTGMTDSEQMEAKNQEQILKEEELKKIIFPYNENLPAEFDKIISEIPDDEQNNYIAGRIQHFLGTNNDTILPYREGEVEMRKEDIKEVYELIPQLEEDFNNRKEYLPPGMKELVTQAGLLEKRKKIQEEIKESQYIPLPDLESDVLKRKLKQNFKDSQRQERIDEEMSKSAENMRNFIKYKFDKESILREEESNRENLIYQNQIESFQQALLSSQGISLDQTLHENNEEDPNQNEQVQIAGAASNYSDKKEIIINPKNGKRFRPNRKHPQCLLCQSPYWRVEPINIPFLKIYLNTLGDILPRYYSGNCAKHQRKISKTIRQAKALGLFDNKKGFRINDPNELPLTPQEQIIEDKYMRQDYNDEELKEMYEEVEMTEEEEEEFLRQQKEQLQLEMGIEAEEANKMLNY